jgi:hypothetical protein
MLLSSLEKLFPFAALGHGRSFGSIRNPKVTLGKEEQR